MERTEIRMQRNQITHTWLEGMENGTATLESSLTISYKLRMQLLIFLPAILIPACASFNLRNQFTFGPTKIWKDEMSCKVLKVIRDGRLFKLKSV